MCSGVTDSCSACLPAVMSRNVMTVAQRLYAAAVAERDRTGELAVVVRANGGDVVAPRPRRCRERRSARDGTSGAARHDPTWRVGVQHRDVGDRRPRDPVAVGALTSRSEMGSLSGNSPRGMPGA